MVDFALDEKGDITFENGDIELINGNNLIVQAVQKLINTNKGEWFLNAGEGINFKTILKKNPNMDVIQNEILQALLKIDDTFYFETFEAVTVNRKLIVKFKAVNNDGTEVEGLNEWA